MTKRKVADIRSKPEPTPRPPAAAARPLTSVQESITDQIGNIILRGGKQDEVELIVEAALLHQWRLRLSVGANWTDEKITAEAYEYAGMWAEESIRQLIQSWEPTAKQKEAAPAPNTITEILREDVRGRLESRFEEFLAVAVPEEIRFMDAVLMDWGSQSNHAVDEPQLEIANSFEREIGRDLRYVRVPARDIRDKVVAFMKLLTEPAAA